MAGLFKGAVREEISSVRSEVRQVLANLKTAISVRGLTQAEFALTALKIAPSLLSEIIHERKRPDASLKARIAKELQCDEGWLFSSVTHVPGPAGSRTDENAQAAALALTAAER
jgi:transcriptional regulator with XRE-family HTH domain